MAKQAKMVVDKAFYFQNRQKNLRFLIEHLEDVYDEFISGHPLSNADGFRKDVIDLVKNWMYHRTLSGRKLCI